MSLQRGSGRCGCTEPTHTPKLVAITGGPGGGKTAVIELATRAFCSHVAFIPEAASIIFGGGFPRHGSLAARRASQRAIYYVQREAERLVLAEPDVGLAICDRGTIDGLAYWPGDPADFWSEIGSTAEADLQKYAAVIHLETPSPENGYNHQNPLRVESAEEAKVIDERIAAVWSAHPNRHVVRSTDAFLVKASVAVGVLRALVPACCR